MPYISYFRLGNPEDLEQDPTPGNTYWVVLRTHAAEVAFQALLTTSIKRDHHPGQDQTPSYQFDNGVVLHGEGISFFRKMPEKPLKGLRFCTINRLEEGGSYEIFSRLTEEDHQTQFATLQDLQEFLRSLDIDEGVIPKLDFTGEREFEVMI